MLLLTSLLSLLTLCFSIRAQSTTPNSTTFVYSDEAGNLTVSMSAVYSTGDLFFRIATSAEYDWFGFGIGSQMKGALTFIMYPTKNGSAVTISPRLSTGNTEPAYSSKIQITTIAPLNGSAFSNKNAQSGGEMEVAFICRSCLIWSDPPVDLQSTTQPFMFAFGPISDQTNSRYSDSLENPLRKHSIYGTFTMNMQIATVHSEEGVTVPYLRNATFGASSTATVTFSPHDWSSAIHAVVMCLAFGLLFPLDALITRIFRKQKLHMITQGMIGVLFIVGIGIGFSVSMLFVRSRTVSSPHQILGIIALVLYLAQIPLGIMLRRVKGPSQITPADQSQPAIPTSYRMATTIKIKRLSLGHQILAFLLFAIALTNVGVGFDFALASGYNKLWAPLAIGVMIIYFIGSGFRYMYSSNKKDEKDDIDHEEYVRKAYADYAAEQAARHGQGQGGFGHSQYGQPPAYGETMEMGNLNKNGAQVQVQPQQQYEVPIPRPY